MELDFIKEMFNAIAPRYDFLNRLLSLRQDVYWRRVMISSLNLTDQDIILDVACGTGDVMIEIIDQSPNQKQVIGVDFAPQMLKLASNKLASKNVGQNIDQSIHQNIHQSIQLLAGNGLHLPFAANTFDAITIAFGIRNIMDRKSALTCFFNCLKPGGALAVLELATPKHPLFLSLYLFYFKRILPIIGAFFSKQINAYTYLPESVINFPPADKFAAIMKQAGFRDIKWQSLTMGIATVFIGYKPGKKIVKM